MSFELNRGQTDSRVKFLSRGHGYTLFLTSDEAVLALRQGINDAAKDRRLRIRVDGANRRSIVAGIDELRGKSNYLIGNDRGKWRTNIPTYASVKYTQIYKGVDLIYRSSSRQQLEYDFVVAPGADPNLIALSFPDAGSLTISRSGDLVVRVGDREVIEHRPIIYQNVNGVRRSIEGAYRLKGTRQVGFQIASWDVSRSLVIDPTLVYSSLIGGSDDEFASGIAVDSSGNAYIAGDTRSNDFPVKPNPGAFQTTHGEPMPPSPNDDAFVSKFDPSASGAASLIYSTFLGGSNNDAASGIVVDSLGKAYVTGETLSTDFPVTALTAFQPSAPGSPPNSAPTNAFVTKLSAGGDSLAYSTYFGDPNNHGVVASAIALDSSANVYITGNYAGGPNQAFPTTAGAYRTTAGAIDTFMSKFDTTQSGAASLRYSTLLGASGDQGRGIAVDSLGNAYITGFALLCSGAGCTNFPTTTNAFQTSGNKSAGSIAFLSKITPAGNGTADLAYSTYLASTDAGDVNNSEKGLAVAVNSGMAYVTGSTQSLHFPTSLGAAQTSNGGGFDAFVSKINPAGLGSLDLVYSTYLGGSGDENNFFPGLLGVNTASAGIAVDSLGNAYVTGSTTSTNFPTANPYQPNNAGSTDAFVTQLNTTGTMLTFSSYLGGVGLDAGRGIAVDGSGNIFIAGYSSSGPTFPFVNGFQGDGSSPNGVNAFVSKFGPATPTATVTPSPTARATATTTSTATPTATATSTPTPTATATATPTPTPTPTATATPTSTPTPTPIPALTSGAFVIGDLNAVVDKQVTFWADQWSKLNSLSGGPAPADFKGFASQTTAEPPQCGTTWTTQPGNSSDPPATIPDTMAVIVSSSVSESGSTIAGNTREVVLVKTNPGYAPAPGHVGTGTVIAIVCHQ